MKVNIHHPPPLNKILPDMDQAVAVKDAPLRSGKGNSAST